MCVAIYKPANADLDMSLLERCWNNHPDGAGFMYARSGRVVIVKELFSFGSFYKKYIAHVKNGPAKKGPVVLHFRTATRGDINLGNSHPLRISANLAFVHNGTLTWVNVMGEVSDSVAFRDDFLSHPKFKYTDPALAAIEKRLGRSKMVFMDGRGRVEILNERLGVWDDDCWFSNDSFQYDWANVAMESDSLASDLIISINPAWNSMAMEDGAGNYYDTPTGREPYGVDITELVEIEIDDDDDL